MKKIGILFGFEDGFQWALIDRVNAMGVKDVRAEALKTGHVTMGVPAGYAVILDRISHDIPFYKALLKNEVLCGTQVINDPFWSIADDKFFENALAGKLGVAVPKTVLLPHREHPPDTTSQSMRNLIYPLDWDAIFSYVGWPAFMKQHYGGGWKHVHKLGSPDEFFRTYAQTGTHLMMLQEAIEFQTYYRCYCLGREEVRVMPYEPRTEHALRYRAGHPPLDPALHERIVRETLTLNRALGYDFNTAEFAVRDGTPVAIDFMNWAPDCDRNSVGDENFEWIVERAAKLLVDRALHPKPQPAYGAWRQALPR
jgi:hypothetical protein